MTPLIVCRWDYKQPSAAWERAVDLFGDDTQGFPCVCSCLAGDLFLFNKLGNGGVGEGNIVFVETENRLWVRKQDTGIQKKSLFQSNNSFRGRCEGRPYTISMEKINRTKPY